MQRFDQSLKDENVADLVAYIGARFMQKPAWTDVAKRARGMQALQQ